MQRVAELADLGARIDEAAAAADRDPATIRRVFNVAGQITDGARGDGPLDGPVDLWVATLVDWATTFDVHAFVIWPPDTDPRHVERLAAEVMPAVRRELAS